MQKAAFLFVLSLWKHREKLVLPWFFDFSFLLRVGLLGNASRI
jgi:hypothetical protein